MGTDPPRHDVSGSDAPAASGSSSRLRGLVVPGIAALVVTACLASLGTWQMRRLAWKEDLNATIAARTALPPAEAPALGTSPAAEEIDFRPVRLAGRFLPGMEAHVFATLGEPRGRYGGPGLWVMAPFERADGSIVWIDRGFVPGDRTSAEARGERGMPEPQTLEGLARPPEPRGSLTPADDVKRNLFFVRDPAALSAAFGLDPARTAPFTVDLFAAHTPAGGLPQAGETRLVFENRHLGYAITWYGLAATCVGVFAAWGWRSRGVARTER